MIQTELNESFVMSYEHVSNVMSPPIFGRFEFIEKIPGNDAQDMRFWKTR